MDPIITMRGPFAVLGIQTQVKRGSETPELFAGIWRQFESHGQEIESLSNAERYYGVSFPTDQEEMTDYLAGMMVPDDSPVPDGFVKRNVPSSQFAVFECPVEAIGESYRYIFTVWLQSASVSFDPSIPVFEEYPGKSSPQPVRIHIPIRQRA